MRVIDPFRRFYNLSRTEPFNSGSLDERFCNQGRFEMTLIASWIFFFLGIAHIIFDIIRYKSQFQDAIAEGLIGKFSGENDRGLAFWFTIMGIPIALIGFVAVHSVSAGDFGIIKIIGFSFLGTGIAGVLAFPKSPLWLILLLSPIFILGGYGLIH